MTSSSRGAAVARSVLRYGYAPAMILGVNGVGIHLVSIDASKAWLLALLLGAIALSLLAERAVPYHRDWKRSRGDRGRDVAHALVNETANIVLLVALPFVAARVTVVGLWPRSWPLGLQTILAVVVFDCGVTLAHYASHRVSVLWRLHAAHHSVRRFYGFNGLMKHPLHQLVELTAGATPLLLVGMPVDVATAMAVCVVVQLLLQHSNVDYRVGFLRSILALNEGHRFHHLRWPGIGDVNFGLFTLVWDHLLGTYCLDPRRRFTSADLGIEKWARYPSGYIAQLAAPFGDQERHAAETDGVDRDRAA